jgi:RNA-directed DNA polymerase
VVPSICQPDCPFERYADDAVVHCHARSEALQVLEALNARMEQAGLRLHPEKTTIVCAPRAQEGEVVM